jgi:hypothetical protein
LAPKTRSGLSQESLTKKYLTEIQPAEKLGKGAGMNQKRASALTLIVMLSVVVVTPIAFTNLANANFVFPPSNPHINFISPVNTTYIKNTLFLKVNITTYLTGWYGGPRNMSLTQLEYSLDNNSFQPLEITDSVTEGNPGNTAYFDCLISLYNLSEGNHTLTVKAVLDYYSYEYPNPGRNDLHTESVANAYLFIDAIPDNTPTPINSPIENSISPSELFIPVVAVIAILAACVAVYFLRIKR